MNLVEHTSEIAHWTWSHAPLIAPQLVWPMTSTSFAPLILPANSMLSTRSASAMLPAMRVLKMSPSPRVEDELRWRARIDATQNDGMGILPGGSNLLVVEHVSRGGFSQGKAFIAGPPGTTARRKNPLSNSLQK
jgi:hypothetical protein